ncbi:MAG: response regulator [Anaerolineales bacterium]
MDQNTFFDLFKDLLAHLYDRASVETHPLAAEFPPPPRSTSHRAETIQNLIFAEIEQLRPAQGTPDPKSPEWRPYLILRRRYIEGLEPAAIAVSLFISERQFRRDHSRATRALCLRVWERYFETRLSESADGEEQPEFDIHIERLDLHEVLKGVLDLNTPRLSAQAIRLDLDLAPEPPLVLADRILLRQILLNLFNLFFHLHTQPRLDLCTRLTPAPLLRITFEGRAASAGEAAKMQALIQDISGRLQMQCEAQSPSSGQIGAHQISILFPTPHAKTVLVIDDQPAALKMFQRYLSRTGLEVIGVEEPAEAVKTAREVQPALIILDVMMPRLDGWEILQAIKVDPGLQSTPVVVCSAWADPDLAHSLGAAACLKKPIFQKDLLETLARFGLLEG